MTYQAAGVTAITKADGSPVTASDHESETIILAALRRLAPDVPVVSEEAAAAGHAPAVGARFFLVDPLDGTKEFIGRNGEFTVNIALIEAREAVLGVVLAPARAHAWWGARGKGAKARDADGRVRAIAVRRAPARPVAIASRSHRDPETQAFLDQAGVAECISAGSSLKFCLVAEGKADLYPRFGRTMEWDVAAGHAVLAAAGGRVTTRDGAPFLYRKPGFENPPFIARGG
jgi:3'(2'), 5'-bisphosphate nucleotidase